MHLINTKTINTIVFHLELFPTTNVNAIHIYNKIKLKRIEYADEHFKTKYNNYYELYNYLTM